jgi:hypothetical protein
VGREAAKVERITEGEERAGDLDADEQALAALVERSVKQPARLGPADLQPVVDAYGERAAIDVAAYLTSFHFINRIADLVGIQSDLAIVQPRWRWLRRLGIRFQGFVMGRMVDMSRPDVDVDVASILEEADAVLGPLPSGFQALHGVPNVAGFLGSVTEVARQLDAGMLARVAEVVADALPSCEEEATGFHPRPADPLEALAFVGTRYAARTTDGMVDAVREKYGYGDPELTDLFYAISMRNGLERMLRVLAEPPRAAGAQG